MAARTLANRRPRCFLYTTRLNTIGPSPQYWNRTRRSSFPVQMCNALLSRPSLADDHIRWRPLAYSSPPRALRMPGSAPKRAIPGLFSVGIGRVPTDDQGPRHQGSGPLLNGSLERAHPDHDGWSAGVAVPKFRVNGESTSVDSALRSRVHLGRSRRCAKAPLDRPTGQSDEPRFNKPECPRLDIEFGVDAEWQDPLRFRVAERKVGGDRQIGPSELVANDALDRRLEGRTLLG